MIFPQKAMILAAGLGKRMRPLTETLPKPLVPVAGRPLIDWSLDILIEAGIEQVIVNSFYLAELLETHLATKRTPKISISREETLLETGGGIKKALPLLGQTPFFALNSDTITLNAEGLYLHRMAKFWNPHEMDGLLLLAERKTAIGYSGQGDFHIDDKGRIRRREPSETAPLVFTGVQLLHPRLFRETPDGAFSMNFIYDRDISRMRAIVHNGLWLHVGDPQGKEDAEKILNAEF